MVASVHTVQFKIRWGSNICTTAPEGASNNYSRRSRIWTGRLCGFKHKGETALENAPSDRALTGNFLPRWPLRGSDHSRYSAHSRGSFVPQTLQTSVPLGYLRKHFGHTIGFTMNMYPASCCSALGPCICAKTSSLFVLPFLSYGLFRRGALASSYSKSMRLPQALHFCDPAGLMAKQMGHFTSSMCLGIKG